MGLSATPKPGWFTWPWNLPRMEASILKLKLRWEGDRGNQTALRFLRLKKQIAKARYSNYSHLIDCLSLEVKAYKWLQKRSSEFLEDPGSNPPISTVAWANILLPNPFCTGFSSDNGKFNCTALIRKSRWSLYFVQLSPWGCKSQMIKWNPSFQLSHCAQLQAVLLILKMMVGCIKY